MSISALIFLAVFGLGLLLALIRGPIFGLLTYIWVFYNPPADRWWGLDFPDLRWALVAALVTWASIVLHRSPLRSTMPPWHANWGVRLLMILTAWMWLQTVWALDPAEHIFLCTLFTKYVLLFYLIYRLSADEKNLNMVFWMHVVGCFLWGWEAFHTTVTGRLENIGGSDVSGSDGAGLQLLIGLIFAGFMFLSQRGVKRWILVAMIPFILNAIVLTASRGTFVAMFASGLAALYFAPPRYRFRLYLVSILAFVLLLRLGNDVYWERMGTLQETQEEEMERSAQSRIVIARANWQMALEHPLGVGHRGNEILSPNYIPKEYLLQETGTRAAHNTFMAIIVDHGFPGAMLFVCFVLWGFAMVWRLNRLDKAKLNPELRLYVAAIGPALLSSLVGGQFNNFFKAEIQVWLSALLVVLYNLSAEAVGERAESSAIDVEAVPPNRFPRPEAAIHSRQ